MLFTFPSRYLFTIGHSVVLSLGEWSPHFQTEFLVLRPTQELNCFLPILDYHHLRSAFPRCSSSYNQIHRLVRFATTFGVSVDFLSYRYLDVSVPCVRFATLCIHVTIQIALWVSPFGHSRINAYSQLPVTFRSVLRPSSPLSAKAFTKCPYLSLDS